MMKNKLILMLGIFLTMPILNGCVINKMDKEIEPQEITIEEKTIDYELKINQLKQEISILNKTKEHYKNYSNYCYDLVISEQQELKDSAESHTLLYNEMISYKNFTWTGCKDSKTIRKFCNGCNWELECSGSMKPTFSCENTLYFCSAKKDEISVGDIIAFIIPEYKNDDYETFYTIHRIIDINSDGKYTTKGDGNIDIDTFHVSYNNVLGKLWKVEG